MRSEAAVKKEEAAAAAADTDPDMHDMHDMHDSGVAAEKKPVGSLLPDTPEKKCVDDRGESIWCGGSSSVASPVDEAVTSPSEITDAHKKCTDSEGNPIWCTQPGAAPGSQPDGPGGAQDSATAAAASVTDVDADAAAPEKKCTNEAGEAIWCD